MTDKSYRGEPELIEGLQSIACETYAIFTALQ
jgi:hypothetical protein